MKRSICPYHKIHVLLAHILITSLPTRLALELAYHLARQVRYGWDERGAWAMQLAEGHEAVEVRAEGGEEGGEVVVESGEGVAGRRSVGEGEHGEGVQLRAGPAEVVPFG